MGWRTIPWQNVAYGHIPLYSSTTYFNHGAQEHVYNILGCGRHMPECGGILSEQPPEFLGLHTIQTIVMTIVSFPQNAQRCVIWSC